MAVKYSQKLDEPVCDVFADICDGYVELYRSTHKDAPTVVEYFGGPVPHGTAASGEVTFGSESDLPSLDDWMHELSGPVKSWRSAALLSAKVVRAKLWVSNPLPGLLTPRVGQRVVYSDKGIKVGLLTHLLAHTFLHVLSRTHSHAVRACSCLALCMHLRASSHFVMISKFGVF